MPRIFVRVNNAGRTYLQGKIPVKVLASVTCAVVPGDRVAVVGPSGSGKSTLLHPKKIGFVFQMETLLAPLTAVENVELPLLLEDVKPLDAHTAALKALKDLELESIADKLPEELSGGQAQRVAVARALSSRPKLILADEPTGQLDHPTAQRLFDVLLASIEDGDTALIVATHDPAIAGRMRTTWHLRHGRLEVEQ
jgi:ABC-type lipoprotein export system ATPase subunit